MQLVSEELDDVCVLDFAGFLVFGLLYLVEELLSILCLAIIILLVLRVGSPGQRLLEDCIVRLDLILFLS